MMYRHLSNSLPGGSFCTAAVLLLALASLAYGHDSPHATRQSAPNALATPVPLDLGSYAALKDRQHLTIADFTLDDGSAVTLELNRFEIVSPCASICAGTNAGDVPLPRPQVAVFRGFVSDRQDSRVFLSLSPFGVYGTINLDGETRVITSGPPGAGLEPVLFNLTTLPEDAIDWLPFVCAVKQAPSAPIPPPDSGWDERGTHSGPCYVAEIAIETDWEFTGDLFGGDTDASTAYATTLLGAVGEIYWSNVGTELQISYLRVWGDSGDPWDQPDAGSQLEQFRDYWNANMDAVQRNLAHFLSARNLGGGVAYLPGVCNGSWAYGLSGNIQGHFPYPLQDHRYANWDPFVVAHEMGHNFGAPHTHDMNPIIDGCGLGDCSDSFNGTIMSYCHTCPGGMLNICLEFHQRIIDEAIQPHLNSTVCLANAGPVILTQPLPTQNACVGADVVLQVDDDAFAPLYQWRIGSSDLVDDGAHVFGATTDTLLLVGVTEADEAENYNCAVTNFMDSCETVSDNAQIIVDLDIVFTEQPTGVEAAVDDAVFFHVVVDNAPLMSFQWRKDGVPLADDGRITGTTSSQMWILPVALADAGQYDCVITSLIGVHCSETSDAATLNVVAQGCPQPGPSGNYCTADIYPNNDDGVWDYAADGDCIVDISDLGQMLASYGVTSSATREDGDVYPPEVGDGAVDISDLGQLLAQYPDDCN